MNTQTNLETVVVIEEIVPSKLGNTDTARANAKRATEEIYKIPLNKVVVRQDFNIREDYGDIESLAKSILENGQTIAGRVDVLTDGTFVITDGHRRFRALKLLEEQGHEVTFKAILNSKRMTEEERIIQMFTTQDNKPLEGHEIAELIKRLINLGWKQTDIAKKIGKTDSYVSQMLNFANEGIEVKNFVKEGKVKISTVLALQKEEPSQNKRTAIIKEAVEKTSGTDKKTLTAEDVLSKKQNKQEALAKNILEVFMLGEESYDVLIGIIKKHS